MHKSGESTHRLPSVSVLKHHLGMPYAHKKRKKKRSAHNEGRSFIFVQWEFGTGSDEKYFLNCTSPSPCPSSFIRFPGFLFYKHTVHEMCISLPRITQRVWFSFLSCQFMSALGWHRAFSQLVCRSGCHMMMDLATCVARQAILL